MKKTLIILLIVIAIPLYSYNVYILLQGTLSGNAEKQVSDKKATYDIHELIASTAPVHFEKKGRSPFFPYPVSDKPPISEKKMTSAKPLALKEQPKAPAITINGIMWNPQNPVAMISMPDGSSTLAKAGQIIAGITIKKIEKTGIVVEFGKKEYKINR